MQLFILKTNIGTDTMMKAIRSVFIFHPSILDWSVDLEDIDKVLRIEAEDASSEREIIDLLRTCGVRCEALT